MKIFNKKLNKSCERLFLFFILISCMFIYYYFGFDKIKNYAVELFTNQNNNINPWSEDLKQRFISYQYTMSRNDCTYDLEMLQQQTTSQEVEDYLKTGYWNWDETLKKLYLDKVESSTLVNIVPEQSLDYAMKIYSPNAVKQLLAWNYKEGEFLLYGAKDINKNIIKCSSDENSFLIDISGNKINDEDVPKLIPGFSFINESCNPCVAFNDSECQFKLNVNGDNSVSEIWKKIWNL
jgi:hypothetical protein